MFQKLALSIGFISFFSTVAFSQQKYGIVDMQQVILSVEEGKKAREGLEKEIKQKEAEMAKKKEELDKLNKDFQSKSNLLTDDARNQKQKEFQEKFFQFRNEEMSFQQSIKQKEQKATQGIAVKVAAIVEKMAAEKKLEAVFEMNSAGLLYLSSPVELTKDVIARYEKDAKSTPAKKEPAKK